MFKQSPSNTSRARVVCFSPGFNPRANLVDQIQLDELTGIIEALCVRRGDNVASRPSPFHLRKDHVLAVVAPVLFWLHERRVEDQVPSTKAILAFRHW